LIVGSTKKEWFVESMLNSFVSLYRKSFFCVPGICFEYECIKCMGDFLIELVVELKWFSLYCENEWKPFLKFKIP